ADQRSRANYLHGWERLTHRIGFFIFALGLLIIGAGAVVARIYSTDLAALASGVTLGSVWSVSFFICLQVVFVIVSLGGAISLRNHLDRARIAAWSEEIARLETSINGAPDRHARELALLHSYWRGAWLTYRQLLVEKHPDPAWQIDWQRATCADSVTDAGPRRVFPGIGPAPRDPEDPVGDQSGTGSTAPSDTDRSNATSSEASDSGSNIGDPEPRRPSPNGGAYDRDTRGSRVSAVSDTVEVRTLYDDGEAPAQQQTPVSDRGESVASKPVASDGDDLVSQILGVL
ncbi:MAG: hypothetical protein ACREHV_17525, partial [Rhizomicrobium sp.]